MRSMSVYVDVVRHCNIDTLQTIRQYINLTRSHVDYNNNMRYVDGATFKIDTLWRMRVSGWVFYRCLSPFHVSANEA